MPGGRGTHCPACRVGRIGRTAAVVVPFRHEPDSSPRRRIVMSRDSRSKPERLPVRMLRAASTIAPAFALALAAAPAAYAANGGQAAPAPSPPPHVRPVVRPSGPEDPAFQLTAPQSSFVGGPIRLTCLVRHRAR